jgi:hypothetical protein
VGTEGEQALAQVDFLPDGDVSLRSNMSSVALADFNLHFRFLPKTRLKPSRRCIILHPKEFPRL